LVSTIDDIACNMDAGTQTDLLILDLKSAFDTVPHQRLLEKISHYGVRGQTLRWIVNWLTTRTQRVVVGGTASISSLVLSGVPQGTVLGRGTALYNVHQRHC
jgi:hypothetical protein